MAGAVLILLTIALFGGGFAEKNSGYSIAGAIVAGCAMIALAIYNRRGSGD